MSAAPDPAGTIPSLPRAFGALELLVLLGRGERGEIYAALQPGGVDRYRAVKILPGTASGNAPLVAALQAEALTLVRRIHGNVVPIYDVGQVDDRLFFVTELVEGRDLGTVADKLRQGGSTLPPDLAVTICLEVAAATAYLRRNLDRSGGDAAAPSGLTAGAVMLSLDGDVKLLHYGSAMSAALQPRPGRAISAERVALVAPELAKGGGSAAGDVYTIGALLWQLLVGRPLAEGAPDAHLAALATGTFRPKAPSAAGARVPEGLDRVVLAALAPLPERPRDADELRGELAPLLRGLGGGGLQAVGDLVRQVFGASLAEERKTLDGVALRAEEQRAVREATGSTPGPVTLARIEASHRSRIATPVEADLAPGEIIAGTRYRALSKLGQGGMGAVYAAEHVDIEKKVALKLLHGEMLRSPEILQQFRQEARAASKIGNPYICDVTDFGETLDGRVFFVMEYLDGQSLGRVLRGEPRLEVVRALPILRQVAKALGAAHEKNIVHLDVKPDNIMLLDKDGRTDAVKVVDFGIAGLLDKGKGDENVAGTPEYLAPERALARGYDHRSDVYSLGCLAYELLTGHVPFHGQTVLATLTMQTKDPPVPLRRKAPDAGIPEALEKVVLRMMEKDPAARPQSMAEVEALLCEAQIEIGLHTAWDDLPLPAVDEVWRQKLADRMPSPTGRPRRAVVFAAIGAAVLAAGFAVYFGFFSKPKVVVVKSEVTKTEEVEAAVPLLEKAEQAFSAQRYVDPPGESALDYIKRAELAAQRVNRTSPGATKLRKTYAHALETIGDELLGADLKELAVVKWKQALEFSPEDEGLQGKAGLSLDEKKAIQKRSHEKVREGTPAAAVERPRQKADEARDAATRIFLAARDGRFSEAKAQLRTLADFDVGGMEGAHIADSLRKMAGRAWGAGRYDDARPLYELVIQLDPSDLEAKERSKPGARPAPTPTPVASAPPVDDKKDDKDKKDKEERKDRKKRGKDVAAAEDEKDQAPRDAEASRKAAEQGEQALSRGHLGEAEEAFGRAVRADSQNPVAVGGVAAVAFERARYSEAMDYARRASRLAPRAPKYLIIMGDAYFKLLRYDEALAAYQKAKDLGDAGVKARIDRVNEKLGKK